MRVISKIICFFLGHKKLIYDLPTTVKLIPPNPNHMFNNSVFEYDLKFISDQIYNNEIILGSDVNGGYRLYLAKDKISTRISAYDAEITYNLIPCKRCGYYIQSNIKHLRTNEEIKLLAEEQDGKNQKINDENLIRNIIE